MNKTQIALGALAIALAAGAGGYFLNNSLSQGTEAAAVDGHGHGEAEASAEGKAPAEGEAKGADTDAEGHSSKEGALNVSDQQIAIAGIRIVPVTSAPAGGEVLTSGTLTPASGSTAEVTARTTGVVTRLLRQVGDSVRVGDGLAIIDSREVAEAQAALARSTRAEELARTVFAREESLYRQKVIARADFDSAKAAFDSAKIDTQLAREALKALGAGASSGNLRLLTVRSPVAGEVTAVTVTPGEFVSAERDLFQVANRPQLWADLRIPAREAARVTRGQRVTITAQGSDQGHPGTIRFLSPAIDSGTGAVRAIAVVQDPEGELRIGLPVTARISVAGNGSLVPAVPVAALHEVEGKKKVFVRTKTGFVARAVEAGPTGGTMVPILSGLKQGEQVAADNSFSLKAELGKSEAEHAH